MVTEQAQTYVDRSRIFLVKAREELAAGDLEQASEKAWGAAALMAKAVAEVRGLIHEKHGHLFNVIHELAREAGDQELRRLFSVASGLHGNFYENTFDREAVGEGIDDVEWFVEKVAAVLDAYSRLGHPQ